MTTPICRRVAGLLLLCQFTTGYCDTPQSDTTKNSAETQATVTGLIFPGDNSGVSVRNRDGHVKIQWTPHTQIALVVNTRLFKGLKGRTLSYRIHSSRQILTYQLPPGPVTAIITPRDPRRTADALNTARTEKWISEVGLHLRFGEPLPPEHLPTPDDPRFIGAWNPSTTPRSLTINTTQYELSLKKGGQTDALLYGVITPADCEPFVNRATVIGTRKGNIIVASEIHVLPIGDQVADDDPKLPRYLFIGDSISGNYSRGLRKALDGMFNLHHPPTNCGPSKKGKLNIIEWLGAYEVQRRHWDVISFNFGHWDVGNDKNTYQANLESVIKELHKTGAKLIWVTTCPVPQGFPPAGDLTSQGRAPRRTAGVMKKYLNPWAREVVTRHPEITVCDQWQFVKDHQDGLYKQWWDGKNVHFGGDQASALGRLLANHVKQVTKH